MKASIMKSISPRHTIGATKTVQDMKTKAIKRFHIHNFLTGGATLAAIACLALCAPSVHAGVATITFTIQQGNLQTNGFAYGSGSGYSGVVDGHLNDGNPNAALATATATNALGNSNQATPAGNNGRQNVGLFSYDLTELNSFIAANNSASNAVTIQSVSFQLTAAGGVSGSSMGLNLYGTDTFTSSATWSNLNGSTPWSNPYQNLTAPANTQQYGYTGGGSALTPGLGGTSPNTTITAGNPLTWTTSPAFVGAVQNALARTDKKLYLTARSGFFSNSDNRLNVNFSSVGTAAYRPQLTITLQINTSPSTWTGASDTSWITANNWTSGSVPTTDSQIIFNSSSTANLSTVLNQNFATTNLIVTTPSGPVSIGGANTLTLNGSSAIDLSGATNSLTITAPVVLGAGQAWNVAANQTLSVNGGISGSYSLTNNGPGTLVLGGTDANTNLTVKGGTVNFATDGNMAGNPYPLGAYPASATAAAVTLSGGGASLLATASTTIDTNRGITLVSPGGALDASSGQTLTVNSIIAGSGALIKGTNSGTVLLNTANTLTGSTTINGGTLQISSSGKLYGGTANSYAVTVNSGGTLSVYSWAYGVAGSIGNNYLPNNRSGSLYLTVNGGTITYTGIGEGSGSANNARLFSIGPAGATLDAEGTGTWYLEASDTYDTNSSGVFIGQSIPMETTLTLTGSGNGRYNKVLSGSGALAKSGAGTWTLAGSSNTYSGGTTINGGTLVPGNTNAIGAGTLTVNSGGIFYPVAATMAFSNAVTLNGGTLNIGGSGGNVLRLLGLVTVTSNSTIKADGGTYGVTLPGGLEMGSGGHTLSSFNNNSGNGNTIAGQITGANGTIMNTGPGTLWITASNTFAGTFRASNGPISFTSYHALQNATLDMNAADTGAVGLSTGFGLVIGALTGSRDLALGSGTVYIGNNGLSTTYSGALSGNASVAKSGSGTLSLNGANIYTGLTTVYAGTLGGTGVISGPVTVAAGGTLAPGNFPGTLIINNAFTNKGTVFLELNASSLTADQVTGVTDASYGGSLVVSNLSATPVAAGQTYQLFTASGTTSGNFTNITLLGTGASGLTGTFNPANGQLTLASSVVSQPVINQVTVSAGDLILQGTNGASSGTYSILTSTDVALPLSSWTTNTSGTFTAGGAFSNAIPVTTEAQRFFLIKQP
jgi:fibronectin-binding autotransporter adhesin